MRCRAKGPAVPQSLLYRGRDGAVLNSAAGAPLDPVWSPFGPVGAPFDPAGAPDISRCLHIRRYNTAYRMPCNNCMTNSLIIQASVYGQ